VIATVVAPVEGGSRAGPAGTVGRWHREGFRGCWTRSRRRPGRPRIDAQLRSLIGRMATVNCLWGAPRIHGELLKLGFTVPERTVSRYMPDRRKVPSQSWRTFLANEFGQLTFAPMVTSSDAVGVHDVADARVCRFAPLSLHSTGGRSLCRAVDTRRSVSLASPFSWRASCPRSRAPPHNPRSIAKTAEVVRRRIWAERVRDGGALSFRDSISNNELTSALTRFDPLHSIAISGACAITSSASHHAEVSSPCRSSTGPSVILRAIGILATHTRRGTTHRGLDGPVPSSKRVHGDDLGRRDAGRARLCALFD
jgi:hypothetical protein